MPKNHSNKYAAPSPSAGVDFTDRYGETMNVAAAGSGRVLFTLIPANENEHSVFFEIEAVDIIPIFTEAVRQSGKGPSELRVDAMRSGLVRPRQGESRQERRARERANAKMNKGVAS